MIDSKWPRLDIYGFLPYNTMQRGRLGFDRDMGALEASHSLSAM